MCTSKELMIACIEGDDAGRVPVCPPFQGFWALHRKGIRNVDAVKNPAVAAYAQVEVTKECGFDAIETMWDWLSPVQALGCKVEMPEYGPVITRSHVLRSPADLERMTMPDFHEDARIKSAKISTEIIRDKIGSDVFLYMTICAPFTLVGELIGIDNLMILGIEEPDFVHEAMRLSMDITDLYVDNLVSLDTDGFMICDPTASGFITSKCAFEDYSMPTLKGLRARFKDEGRYSMLHICGESEDIIDGVNDIRPDVFSMSFYSDLGQTRMSLDQGITLLGNIDPVSTLYAGSRNEVIREATRCITAVNGRGMMLGAGCDLEVGTPIENVSAMRQVSEALSVLYR